MHGFDSAISIFGLRNHQRDCFHGWPKHWTAQTAHVASEIMNETAFTGDAWIRQRNQPLWPKKTSTKTESLSTQKPSTEMLPWVTHGFHGANSPCGVKTSTKLLQRVTHGFDSANNPCVLNNYQRNGFHGWGLDSAAQTTPLTSEIIY